jgi:hypothetical protein
LQSFWVKVPGQIVSSEICNLELLCHPLLLQDGYVPLYDSLNEDNPEKNSDKESYHHDKKNHQENMLAVTAVAPARVAVSRWTAVIG